MDRQPPPFACLIRSFLGLVLHCLLASALLACALPAFALRAAAPVTLLTIDGPIGPASADYLARGMAGAARGGSQLVIIQMDTPGGLDTSMRTVIKAILSSPLPVATYVAPSGARAASAGTYIAYASHIAAMAPGTNLGAATPVQIGAPAPGEREPPPGGSPPAKPGGANPASPMAAKQVNDAAAYLRGLAQMRGRNADWAERAVRESVSLPASEALKIGVVDVVAADVPALLSLLNGRRVTVLGRELTLDTRGAAIVPVPPDWRARLLGVISDPAIALLLITIGIYGLLFEFMSPGALAPGVIGAMCLLLGLYGLQLLPVNYAGLALVLLGLAFMVAEAFLPSFGSLGLGGVIAFVVGALILIDTELPGFGIPIGLIVTMALASALLMVFTAGVALRTRRRPAAQGSDKLVGSIAEVIDNGDGASWANVQGETWRVASTTPLQRTQKVRVLARRGALLEVAPLEVAPLEGAAVQPAPRNNGGRHV